MSFEIRRATRIGVTPLIALYSESGCGKTYSALLMARGLAGPAGQIIMIDSEGGRGELYADVEELGGYDVIQLEEPFSPQRYIDAIKTAQAAGAAAVIVDSGSHEWEGVGGVLDMAAENEAKSGRAGLHNWKKPKFQHALFIQALTRATIPLIICLRAKFKTRMVKVDTPSTKASLAGGFQPKKKTEVVKDDFTSPIQAEDFIFEATCHGEIMPNHHLRLTKWSHPKLKTCFPANGMITIEAGQKIQEWCQSAGEPNKPSPAPPPAAPVPEMPQGGNQPDPKIKSLKQELWAMTKHIHMGEPLTLEEWLRDKIILKPEESLAALDADRLNNVIDMAAIAINEEGSR